VTLKQTIQTAFFRGLNTYRLKTHASIAAWVRGLLLALGFLLQVHGQPSATSNLPVTNLFQLVTLLNSDEQLVRDVQIEATVCAASAPSIGVVILQDSTDTELFEFTGGTPELSPGDRIRISRRRCLLRRREMGVQVSVLPIVDNNGIHARSTSGGGAWFRKGRHPFTVEWFNREHPPSLEVKWQISGARHTDIPATNLFCFVLDEKSGQMVVHQGLLAECYEGDWERIPNFDLLTPAKTAIVTNCDSNFRTRDQFFGVRFRGFLDAPVDGVYGFTTRSADGSLLFVDDSAVLIKKIKEDGVPSPVLVTIDEALTKSTKQQWVSVEGRVDSVSPAGRGVEMQLSSQHNSLTVRIADATQLNTSNLLNSVIRVTGVGCSLFDLRGESLLGQVFVANAQEVEIIRRLHKPDSSTLVKAEQVQTLALDDARRHLPVQLRGVVTSKGNPFDYWLSLQDETRGIFVNFHNVSNGVPICGDFYEVIGHSGAGDFAPIVIADRIVRLGRGEFPRPISPSWDELNSGSVDVQWVEIKGLVTAVYSNTLSMLLPSGEIEVRVEEPTPSNLESMEKAVVRIRGVLFAVWNAAREVRSGNILMRNAKVTVDTPPPADPFDAVLKTPRELLLFDAQATAFRRVKVRGQIVYADSTQAFLQEGGEGLRLLLAGKVKLSPGDQVEAVGYPNISKSSLLLRETVIRKTGKAALPIPESLEEPQLARAGLDSMRVRVKGKLLGWHLEQGEPVLEMQAGVHLFFARLAGGSPRDISFRSGSSLALTGVYVARIRDPAVTGEGQSFEILINSPADIEILSQPSWWTLPRLLIVIGILLAVLIASSAWIRQLRRLVEQRTRQLHREIQERELAEKQRAVEAERARIARDLHDDLGSSLTEISVLASSGQHSGPAEQKVLSAFRMIAGKARELVAALDTIVWAVDPKDNSLQSFADYLCDFAEEYLSSSGIVCRFDVPVTLPPVVLDGRLRHDLFLAVKESLNNIVRHAGATEVKLRLSVDADRLHVEIRDNGKGFVTDASRAGKGLKNLPARLAKIGGTCDVESTVGQGTTVKIVLCLAAAVIA
jgi:signal transduction histidine kinase